MADEVDFEELTAMLNDSDEEEMMEACQGLPTSQENEGNGDQASFEELSAMLEDSGDEEQSQVPIIKQEKSVDDDFSKDNKQPDPSAGSTLCEESSDDDIDEDELDKLAALVEEEDTPKTIQPPEDTAKLKHLPPNTKVKIEKLEKELEMSDEDENKETAGSEEESEVDDQLNEIQKMKEQIKLMEAALKNKNKKIKSPRGNSDGSLVKSPKLGSLKKSTSKNEQNIMKVKSSNSKSPQVKIEQSRPKPKEDDKSAFTLMDQILGKPKSSPPVKKTLEVKKEEKKKDLVPRVLTDMEEDIFFTPAGESTNKPSPFSPKPSSSSSKISGPQSKVDRKPNLAGLQKMSSKSSRAEDSDSDWEDMDGEKSGLTKEGYEIKKLMKKGEQRRMAHTASYDTSKFDNSKEKITSSAQANKQSNPKKSAENSPYYLQQQKDSSYKPKVEVEEQNVQTDPFSNIKIVKPLISTFTLKSHMEERKFIQMHRLHRRIKTADTSGDWVTIGVVVSKSEPKMSANGKQFSIWTLSDLIEENSVKLMLFGEVHKTHWKVQAGSVVGLLNATQMKENEKYQKSSEDVTITVDHSSKILLMGQSRDFGICQATTKAGRQCHSFINKSRGSFCQYHVSSQYKKQCAKRPDLTTGYTGVVPKNLDPVRKFMSSNKDTIMYGGKSYSATGKDPKKKQVSTKNLATHQGRIQKGKVTTLSLQNILPEDKKMLLQAKQKAKIDEEQETILNLLATPTVGSLNLVKHIVKKEEIDQKNDKDKKASFKSIKVSDMIKTMKQDIASRKNPTSSPSLSSKHDFYSNTQDSSPKLGRGFCPGMEITFSDVSKSKKPLVPQNILKAEVAKHKAIQKIKAKGGVNKDNPNAVKKIKSPESQQKIKKRLASSCDDTNQDSEMSESDKHQMGPPKKRSRILGDLDLDDPEVQKLLKSRSSHEGQLTQMEQERFDQYFEPLEKKEAMEEKLDSIREIKVKAVACKICKYSALSSAEKCRNEHPKSLVSFTATKKFFKCKDCKQRMDTIEKYPTKPCSKCSGKSFVRTSMLRERKGPQLPSEEFKTRGDEEKYLNSLK